MNRIISLAAGAAFSAFLIFGNSTPAFAPADMFLKLGDIKGESSDAAHRDEIDVLAWSWGASSSTRSSTGERLMQPEMGAGSLTVEKKMDRSSAKLQQYCNSGKHLKSVEVSGASGNYTLYDVTVKCATTSADRPTEEVAFYYNKIQYNETDLDMIRPRAKKKEKKKR